MMDKNECDEGLVVRAIGGDRAAFAALVSKHYDLIFRTAFKWCGGREDAEDIAQDVCVRLGSSIRSWSGDSKFSTWLYRVVINAVRDAQRKNAASMRKLDAWAREPSRPDVQSAGSDPDEEAAAELWQAVRQLPPKPREAVTLVYGEGLNHAEAAGAMNCAEGTVSSHIHEAKKQLKILMGQQGESRMAREGAR